LLAALLGPVAAAATAPDNKRTDLEERREALRTRLEALRADLAKSEESRVEAGDQLRATETAISDANRHLRDLAVRRSAAAAELAGLESDARQLDRQIEAQQSELSRLLLRQYLGGDADAMQLLLAGRDPNQAARDYHFLSLLSRAKADLIGELSRNLTEKQQLTGQAQAKGVEIAAIGQHQREQRAALVEQQRAHQVVAASIGERIKAQRRQIETLRRDDQRLARLIENLAKIVARPPTGHSKPPPREASAVIDRSLRNDPAGAGGAFARLRGKLHTPVRGETAHRFGTPRADGGAVWKGLFIRAAEGTEVHAVAAGQVVYADWLRGFGNLLVVDHGDGFHSIYGNNQALLHQAGDPVKSGETLATVGDSGGNDESGLYFELRHQGRPFDPSRWLARR